MLKKRFVGLSWPLYLYTLSRYPSYCLGCLTGCTKARKGQDTRVLFMYFAVLGPLMSGTHSVQDTLKEMSVTFILYSAEMNLR